LLFGAAFVLYVAAAANASHSGWRVSLKVTLILFAIIQGILINAPVERSTDAYRYLWEGKVVLHGVNPLMIPPSSPSLRTLRDGTWTQVNNKTISSVYPPASQAAFALSAWLAPDSILVWKSLMGICSLVAVVCLALWLRERGMAP